MKRYKQAILSNFFVAINEAVSTEKGSAYRHLVEANLDIESRCDRTLCTEVLQGAFRYEVLTNPLLVDACPICSAILARRISNMPIERKLPSTMLDQESQMVPESQLKLELLGKSINAGEADEKQKSKIRQFELLL
ncbi:MAG: hypothetical protein ACR2PT_09000 [Endozoicomonas sp.]